MSTTEPERQPDRPERAAPPQPAPAAQAAAARAAPAQAAPAQAAPPQAAPALLKPGSHPSGPRPGPPPAWDPAAPAWHTTPWPAPPPWPPRGPSELARRWPGPGGAAGRAVVGGALLTGLAAAAGIPLDRPGVGWLVAGVVGAASVVAALRHRLHRPDPVRLAWAVVTLLLLGAGTLRAAGWLFALCVLAAVVTGSLAAAGGRRVHGVRGLVAAAVIWPLASVRSLPWVVRGGGRLGGAELRIGLPIVATVLLLTVFGALFASADPAFARVFRAATPDVDGATVTRWLFLFVVGALALCGAAYLLTRPPDLSGLERPGTRRLRAFEWGLPIAALDLLFAAFVGVQFAVLFGGDEHVLGPGGPDYAEHARSGFGQLLTVTLLTLLVLGAAARWAHRERPSERVLIRVLLGLLATLAMVVVASALYRMHVYEQAYGFTRLRLFVSAFELWLGGLFVLVLAAGVRLRGGWLPRAAVGTAVAALLALVAVDADRFIAERNVDRYTQINRIDVGYLAELSADAAPALDRLDGDLRDCALGELSRRLRDGDDWREANVARARARAILRRDPTDAILGLGVCRWDRW